MEGHIGKAGKTGEIKDAILKIVRKYNLDFDVLEMEAKDTIESYPSAGVAKKVKFNTFVAKIQGAEHLAGVPKGGTFILVTEGGKVIGDFSVPYRCCENPLSIADCKPIIEKMAKTAINESEPEIKKAINEIAANRLKRDEAVKEVLESYNNQVSSEVDARLKELEEKELTNRKESEQIGIKIFDGLVELKGILATLDSITDCDQDKRRSKFLLINCMLIWMEA